MTYQPWTSPHSPSIPWCLLPWWGSHPHLSTLHSSSLLQVEFFVEFLSHNTCRFLVGCAHHTVSHLPYIIGAPCTNHTLQRSQVSSFAVVEYCGIGSRTIPLMMMIVSYTLASLIIPLVLHICNTSHWNFKLYHQYTHCSASTGYCFPAIVANPCFYRCCICPSCSFVLEVP